MASRLHEKNSTMSVAILERGPDQLENSLITNPMAVAQLPGTDLVSTLVTPPQEAQAGRTFPNFAGNTLSGSSAINYGAWMRGHSSDYNQWSSMLKDEGPDYRRWSYKGMLSYLRKTEHHFDDQVDPAVHGLDGPMHTQSSSRKYPFRETVREGLLEAGYKELDDGNNGNPLGFSPWTENWHDGKRQPSASAYSLTGVTVLCGRVAKRILLDAGDAVTARGVELVDGTQVHATREVIVCCGAYRTPQLLMLSGIGPREHLKDLGVPLVVDSPQVGRNHFDHLALHQAWRLNDQAQAIGAAAGHALFNKPEYAGGIPVEWFAVGTLAPDIMSGAFTADGEDSNRHPNLASRRGHFILVVAYAPLALGPGHEVPVDGSNISVGALLCHPTSRGRVTLASADPLAEPIVDPHFSSTNADRCMLREAVREVILFTETPSMRAVISSETPPEGFPVLNLDSSDAAIDRRIERFSVTWHHPMGTAAMGKVVDATLQVKGVSGLRVCDASVFPAPISATPQHVCLRDVDDAQKTDFRF